MEDRRALIVLLALLAAACPAAGYGNDGPHQAINEMAVAKALALLQSDGYPASFDGTPVYGTDALGGYSALPPSLWIVSGGYTADVPDTNSFQHGYNPVTGKGFMGFGTADAWVAGASGNLWSYSGAHNYLARALASDISPERPDSQDLYSSAWRAAGESMHLVADMTVPAHARTDIHPFAEPYEQMTTRAEIEAYGNGPVSGSVKYGTFTASGNIRDLMTALATWTHDNFYSEDTITGLSGEPDADGYYHATVDGKNVVSCRRTLSEYAGAGPGRSVVTRTSEHFTVADKTVLETQQRLLLPNAVYGDALALAELLPRLRVVVDGVAPYPGTGQVTLFAHLVHKPTAQWSTMPVIANGAWVQVNDNAPVYLYRSKNAYSDLSKIQYPLNANPGDRVRLYYDFGGYRISAPVYTVPDYTETTPEETIVFEVPTEEERYPLSTPVPEGTNPFTDGGSCSENPDFPWCP